MYKYQNKDFEYFRLDAIIKMLPRVGKPEVASVVIKPLTKQDTLPMNPITNVSDRVDQINEYPSSFLNSIPPYDYFRIIKKPKVLVMTCDSKSAHHDKILKGLMVPSISIGLRSVAYIEFEILSVVAARIQGKSDDEIRLLVKKLVAQRQNLSLGVTS